MGLPLSVTTGILLVSQYNNKEKVGEWGTSAFILSFYSKPLSLSHTHTLNYTFSSHSTKNFVVFLRAWHKKNAQD